MSDKQNKINSFSLDEDFDMDDVPGLLQDVNNTDDSEGEDKTKQKKPVEKAPEKKKDVKETKEEDDDNEEEEVDAFDEFLEQTTGKKKEKPASTDDNDDDDLEEDDEVEYYTNLVKELKSNDLLSFAEIKEDEKITKERYFEIQDEELQARVDQEIQDNIKGLDDDAKKFLKFKRDGGRTQDFLKVYVKSTTDPNLDLTVDKNKKAVIKKHMMEVEKVDEEDFDERLSFYTDETRIDRYTKKFHTAMVESEKKEKEDVLKRQERARVKAVNDAKEFREGLKETLDKTDSFKGIAFDRKQKTKIFEALTLVAEEDGTLFNKKLKKIINDPEALIALCGIVLDDLELKSVKVAKTTEKNKREKEVIDNNKKNRRAGFSSAARSSKSLAELIPD